MPTLLFQLLGVHVAQAATMDTVIASSSASFSTAFGFGWTDLIAFMKTWLLQVIGAGLGILQALMPYIIGLAVIAAIVYFLYRAFRFFRH